MAPARGRYLPLVKCSGQLPVGGSGRVEIALQLLQPTGQFHDVLFETGHCGLQVTDVSRGTESGLLPSPLTELLRETCLQLLNPPCKASGASVGVGEIGLQ